MEDFQGLPSRKKEVVSPKFGLTVRQMAALGITNDNEFKFQEPDESMLTAKACYVGEPVTENSRIVTRMGPAMRPPGQAPPDLPSLLLDGRIVYIGMPLVPSVTELVISQLLWLNYADPEKPVYVYINSTGTQTEDKQAVGFETEAYAILDTLNYIRPDIHTLAVGSAYGNAAMLLASGKKGSRAALPHARIKTNPPRLNRAMGPAAKVMIAANEMEACFDTYVEFMAKFAGRDLADVRKDMGRDRYFTPEQAIEYGLIDKIVRPTDQVAMDAQDYEAILRAQERRSQGARTATA